MDAYAFSTTNTHAAAAAIGCTRGSLGGGGATADADGHVEPSLLAEHDADTEAESTASRRSSTSSNSSSCAAADTAAEPDGRGRVIVRHGPAEPVAAAGAMAAAAAGVP